MGKVKIDKKMEIVSGLIDIFDRINIDTPSNFEEISEFVYKDVCEVADKNNWNDSDIEIAFRRWIESVDTTQRYTQSDVNKAYDTGVRHQKGKMGNL